MASKSGEKRRKRTPRSTVDVCRHLVRRLQGEMVRLPHVGGHLSYLGVAVEVLEQALTAYERQSELSPRGLSNDEGAALRRRILREAYRDALDADGSSSIDASLDQKAVVFPASSFSVPEVLQFLSFNEKTGSVMVQLTDEEIVIELDEGAVVDARSNNSPEGCRLGEILVQQGAISQQDLDAFLDSSEVGKKPIGEGLSRGQKVTREDVLCALRTQVQRHFQRCVAAEGCDVRFLSHEADKLLSDLNLNLTSLLLESTAHYDRTDSVLG